MNIKQLVVSSDVRREWTNKYYSSSFVEQKMWLAKSHNVT